MIKSYYLLRIETAETVEIINRSVADLIQMVHKGNPTMVDGPMPRRAITKRQLTVSSDFVTAHHSV